MLTTSLLNLFLNTFNRPNVSTLFGIRIQIKHERISQREESRRSDTKGDNWNQGSIKVESVSARYYQQGRAIVSFD